MKLLFRARRAWKSIRWKMLFVFTFFSIVSSVLITFLAVALLNLVVRRESAFLVEERVKAMVENSRIFSNRPLDSTGKGLVRMSEISSLNQRDAARINGSTPAGYGSLHSLRPDWLKVGCFTGVVVDHGHLELRSVRNEPGPAGREMIVTTTPLSGELLAQLSQDAGLQLISRQPVMLQPYRKTEGISGEILANFVLGSQRAVPVVVTARNWQTGLLEDWVLCQVRLSYSRTIEDLSRMGLRPASWVVPLGGITLALFFVYAFGFVLSVQLSKKIVSAINGLSHAAHQVGKGDFSVRVAVSGQDQLGRLASSFNGMTSDLEVLRKQEKQAAILESDIALAREVQQYLYPRTGLASVGVNVWGLNIPARMVSGDLYEFFSFSSNEVSILCADVSGKGVSAAFMMSHLQALAHGRLLFVDETVNRPAPDTFVTTLNRDLHGRFGNGRYATLFYAEFDSRTGVLKYVNAGHCPSILISESGEPAKLPGGDLPVGLFADATYQKFEVQLNKGSVVVVYTDGVTDALDGRGEQFGEERLLECCASIPKGANAETIARFLSDKITAWASGVEQVDDTTILALVVE